jgi:enterochelin esterase-like enzyme
MREFLTIVLLLTVLFGAKAQVQPIKAVPATSNIRSAAYPQIREDGRAVFRLRAPQAKSVQVDLGRKYDMTATAEGVWEVTTDSLSEGFHYYSLLIDGVAVADPASETFYGMSRMASGLEVPFKGDGYYAVKDVPHGDVRQLRYYSTVCQCWRRVFVYTPPGYDAGDRRKYPVLYLLHGGGEDERGWSQQGKTDLILDNLIGQGSTKPMLVVMPDGNVPRSAFNSKDYYDAFDKELNDCLIPFVEKTFRAETDGKNRALAGLSMGGLQTLHVGILHPDRFASLGVFSSGWFRTAQNTNDDYEYLKAHQADFKAKNQLFWIAMGGREDIAFENGKDMCAKLDAIGVKYAYSEYPGGHAWPVWRNNLNRFAPLLFQ